MSHLTDTEILNWIDKNAFAILQSVHGDQYQLTYLDKNRYVKNVTANNVRECVHLAKYLDILEK